MAPCFKLISVKELVAIVTPGENIWHRILITSHFTKAPWGIGQEYLYSGETPADFGTCA